MTVNKVISELNNIVEDAGFNSKDEALSKKDFQNYAKRVFVLHDKLLSRLRNHYSQFAKQQLIRNRANKISNAMISVNKLHDPMGNKEFSILYNLLTFEHNGTRKNCHPVAAMVRLCGLRQCIDAYLQDEVNFAKDYRIGFLSDKEERDRSLIPQELFASSDSGVNFIKQAKSRYCMADRDESNVYELGKKQKSDGKRFYRFKTESAREKYIEKRSAYYTDVQLMKNDAIQGDISINNLVYGEDELIVFDYNNAGDEVLISDLVMEGLLTAYEMDLPKGADQSCREQFFPAMLNGYLSNRKLSEEEANTAWIVYTLYHSLWFSRVVYNDDSLEKLVEKEDYAAANRLLVQMLADMTENDDGRFRK